MREDPLVLHVLGARPNFVKAAPVVRSLAEYDGTGGQAIRQVIVHTGQHYDALMSDVFFADLGLPEPIANLGVGSGSHAVQTAALLTGLEAVIKERDPDLVVVYGDVNSTLAAILVCAKLGVPTAHVEAGLRSFDRGMPEEVNRVVTDALADLLFATSPDALSHLANEGVAPGRVHLVGNPMIDSLFAALPALDPEPVRRRPGMYIGGTDEKALHHLFAEVAFRNGQALRASIPAARCGARVPAGETCGACHAPSLERTGTRV